MSTSETSVSICIGYNFLKDVGGVYIFRFSRFKVLDMRYVSPCPSLFRETKKIMDL